MILFSAGVGGGGLIRMKMVMGYSGIPSFVVTMYCHLSWVAVSNKFFGDYLDIVLQCLSAAFYSFSIGQHVKSFKWRLVIFCTSWFFQGSPLYIWRYIIDLEDDALWYSSFLDFSLPL